LKPDYGLITNVFAYAKTNLREGTILDGPGGYCCYGKVENIKNNLAIPGLPIALASSSKLKRSLVQDEKIYLDDIEIDERSLVYQLFKKSVEYAGIPSSYR
jgi:predicted homoserine dehydrogenase-like protein